MDLVHRDAGCGMIDSEGGQKNSLMHPVSLYYCHHNIKNFQISTIQAVHHQPSGDD
jgi:hypothetical protein